MNSYHAHSLTLYCTNQLFLPSVASHSLSDSLQTGHVNMQSVIAGCGDAGGKAGLHVQAARAAGDHKCSRAHDGPPNTH